MSIHVSIASHDFFFSFLPAMSEIGKIGSTSYYVDRRITIGNARYSSQDLPTCIGRKMAHQQPSMPYTYPYPWMSGCAVVTVTW